MSNCKAILTNKKLCKYPPKYPEDEPLYCGHHKKYLDIKKKDIDKLQKCNKCKCMRLWSDKTFTTCDKCRKDNIKYKKNVRSKLETCQMKTHRGTYCIKN